jgi:hypothetical protein
VGGGAEPPDEERVSGGEAVNRACPALIFSAI